MTMQDIYAWIQIMLLVVVGGGLAWYIRLLKRAVDAQKATIDAQAEHLKAQSTVLQDFARLNEMMKRVIDTLSDPAALQQEEAYRERVGRDAAAQLDKTARGFIALIGSAMPYIPSDERRRLIAAADLSTADQETLNGLAEVAPYQPIGSAVTVTTWERILAVLQSVASGSATLHFHSGGQGHGPPLGG
jgi:hypothetical protein